MSWMEQLVQTYDENERFVGKTGLQGTKAILAPIGHIIVKAKISITLNRNGDLYGSPTVVPKTDADTLIPCTPESASRTSGLSPHPLHDKLQYIARDYENYAKEHKKRSVNPESLLYELFVEKRKEKTKQLMSPYEMYIMLLGAWCSSPYSHPKIQAVYKYVTRHDIIQDLVDHKIVFKDKNNNIIQKWNKEDGEKTPLFDVTNSNEDILKSFVRFRVDFDDGSPVDLWEDIEVQNCYKEFCFSQASSQRNLCYASGKNTIITERHFKSIRFAGDGAKIISSNDNDNFTYRGRFETSKECATISLGASHKIMSVLRWLICNQGYEENEKVFLAWGRCGVVPPAPITDTNRIVRRGRNREKSSIPQTMQAWTAELHKAMDGYRHEFKKAESAQVNLIVLDAATSGRMSICYYSEVAANDFINRIETWHRVGAWRQHNYDKEKQTWWPYFGVPHPKRIVSACYGDKAGDSQVKMALERIFQCIVNGTAIPRDMVRAAVGRVVKRSVIASGEAYKGWYRNLLEPACSLLCNRFYFDHQGKEREGYSVALDPKNKNRSYLYGRLLAVADKLERATYSKEEREKRLTNALKYMERFAQRPCNTWQILQKKLLPYLQKLGKYPYYRELLDEIGSQFLEEDFVSDRPLGGEFLLGFYCQNYDIEQRIALAIEHKKQKSENINAEVSEGGNQS